MRFSMPAARSAVFASACAIASSASFPISSIRVKTASCIASILSSTRVRQESTAVSDSFASRSKTSASFCSASFSAASNSPSYFFSSAPIFSSKDAPASAACFSVRSTSAAIFSATRFVSERDESKSFLISSMRVLQFSHNSSIFAVISSATPPFFSSKSFLTASIFDDKSSV